MQAVHLVGESGSRPEGGGMNPRLHTVGVIDPTTTPGMTGSNADLCPLDLSTANRDMIDINKAYLNYILQA